MKLIDRVNDSIAYIRSKTASNPSIAVILGSGLGEYADNLEEKVAIPYEDIPHFPTLSVEGHKGQLVFGKIHGKEVVCMQGRLHFYEGKGMHAATYAVRVFTKLGVKILFTTNATGGLNENFKPGDLMIIKDHINFMGDNPLIGENEADFGDRFPDMTNLYDPELIKIAEKTAEEIGINIQKGVFIGYSGPNFETPAEIKLFRFFGADNVGMSTIPETIVAKHGKMRVLSISAITNMAAGILEQPLNHEEVLEMGEKMKPTFKKLVDGIIEKI